MNIDPSKVTSAYVVLQNDDDVCFKAGHKYIMVPRWQLCRVSSRQFDKNVDFDDIPEDNAMAILVMLQESIENRLVAPGAFDDKVTYDIIIKNLLRLGCTIDTNSSAGVLKHWVD